MNSRERKKLEKLKRDVTKEDEFDHMSKDLENAWN
jgi:hypothetical protein